MDDITTKYQEEKQNILSLLGSFPQAKNGHPYLRLKNGKRVFFRLFLRKYHFIKPPSHHQKKYTKKDLIGRMRLMHKLPTFFRTAKIIEHDMHENRRILIGEKMKAIIVKATKHKSGKKKMKATYELLSFFPVKE